MKAKTGNSFVVGVMFVIAAVNGLVLFGNGLFMLVDPMKWYLSVPGVTTTGQFNQHFIRDIGIIQMFLGAAFGLGWFRPAGRVTAWAAATSWLIAHALFHVWEVAVGICGPSALARDFPGVSLPALLGIALTVWAWRTKPAFATSSAIGGETSLVPR
jgi:hypothetical protein